MKKKKKRNGFEIVDEYPIECLYTKFKDHRRLTVFANKGTVCVKCGKVGTRLIKRRFHHKDGSYEDHIDLFTKDMFLMTVDHILARADGGGEGLENKQPMCSKCNGDKGSMKSIIERYISNEFLMGGVEFLYSENKKKYKKRKKKKKLLKIIDV
jgi:hypothetical protein